MDEDFPKLADPEDIPKELGDESREKFITYIKQHKTAKTDWDRTSNKVTKYMCDIINEMHSNGVKPDNILEFMPISSPNTIYYHVRGDCEHEYRTQLTYDECGWMRAKAHQGAPSRTLAMLYNLAQEVATIHLTGKCQHEDGIEPISGPELRANSQSGPETTTSVCPICEQEFEHEAYRPRTTCSTQCNVEYASKMSRQKGD